MRTESDILAKTIGMRIRQLRHERNWNQVDLEAHLEGAAKRAAISMYETGQRMPSLTALIQLANAFSVPIAALLLDERRGARDRTALAMLCGAKSLVKATEALLDTEKVRSK